ncbi:hypothetical protein [Larkinella terrae]|uniref:Uncharacterized protein n=1 Tax=Larkinella terrae TaxID=2025311 RepID=A0A7K0EDE2_9BACT|nr:hypothetical protein [Larkinella terrae]MRS59909.1 hypothetical protein [Larkinella terrae]
MHRRNFPSILLYGFGLALALSLVFNGFLLYQQNHRRSLSEYELDHSVNLLDHDEFQQQLSDCMRANQQKDSLIHQLEHPPNPTGSAVLGQHPGSN